MCDGSDYVCVTYEGRKLVQVYSKQQTNLGPAPYLRGICTYVRNTLSVFLLASWLCAIAFQLRQCTHVHENVCVNVRESVTYLIAKILHRNTFHNYSRIQKDMWICQFCCIWQTSWSTSVTKLVISQLNPALPLL